MHRSSGGEPNGESTCDGVALFVIRGTGGDAEVLLLLRAGGGFEGQWCPVAGTVEAGEAPPVAARRELAEETGLELSELLQSQIRIIRPTDSSAISRHIEVFVGRPSDDRPVVLNYEHTDFVWVSFAEAAQRVSLKNQKTVVGEIERVYVRGQPPRQLDFHPPHG